MARSRAHYETDETTFSANAYSVRGYGGIAFRVLGWETEPDEDTEWTGYEVRTGRVIAIMIGDDHKHVIDDTESDSDRSCGVLRGVWPDRVCA